MALHEFYDFPDKRLHFIRVKDTKTDKFSNKVLMDEIVDLSNNVILQESKIGSDMAAVALGDSVERYNELSKYCGAWGEQATLIAQLKTRNLEASYPNAKYFTGCFDRLAKREATMTEEQIVRAKLSITLEFMETMKYCFAVNAKTAQLNGLIKSDKTKS